jgi:hypothetical protein
MNWQMQKTTSLVTNFSNKELGYFVSALYDAKKPLRCKRAVGINAYPSNRKLRSEFFSRPY